ncbi:MAG: T9SS type A sorting domain-containing protein [Candidatus Kapaibacterium sp.]
MDFRKFLSFAIVVFTVTCASYLHAQVGVLFPVKDQIFYPERHVLIVWQNEVAEPVDLLYSTDKGTEWHTIASGLTRTDFDWILPALDTVSITFKVQITNVKNPTQLTNQIKNRSGVLSASFNARGNLIFSTHEDSTASIRTVDNGITVSSMKFSEGAALSSCFYPTVPDTAVIAVGNEVVMYNFYTYQQNRFGAEEHKKPIRCVAMHPTKQMLATACEDGSVRIWMLNERKVLRTITSTLWSPMNTVRFSPDGKKIIYAGDEGIVYVEDWETGNNQQQFRGHGNASENIGVLSIDISYDGRKAVSGGVDNSVRLWDLETGSVQNIMFAHTDSVTSVHFSPDGTRILTGSKDNTVRQWSTATGLELHTAIVGQGPVSAVDYTSTGDTLLTGEMTSGLISLFKNEKTTGASDSVLGYIKYPIGLKVGSVKAAVGSVTEIPIILDKIIGVPYFQKTTFNATCKVVLPSKMMMLTDASMYKTRTIGSLYDTVQVPLTFASNDTVGKIQVKTLLTDMTSQNISILFGPNPIQWQNGVNAFILQQVDGGIFSIDSTCIEQLKRSIEFTETENYSVAPNPATDMCTLKFAAYEAGDYTISMYNTMGEEVLTIYKGALERGSKEFPIDLSSIAAGAYNIRISAPSKNITVRLQVIK